MEQRYILCFLGTKNFESLCQMILLSVKLKAKSNWTVVKLWCIDYTCSQQP